MAAWNSRSWARNCVERHPLGEALGQLGDLGAVVVGRPLGGHPDDRQLEHPAGLEQLAHERLAVVAALGAEADVGQLLGDVRPVAAALDHAERQQALHRLAHRRAGDGELLGQRPLGRHAGAGLELAALDALDEAVADGRAQRLAWDRLEGDVVGGHRRRLYWWHLANIGPDRRVGLLVRPSGHQTGPGGARVHGVGDTTDTPTYELRPTEARWTHIALRVSDIDASIALVPDVHAARAARQAPGRHRLRRLARPARLGRQAVHPRARPVPAGHRSRSRRTRRRSWRRSPTSASSCPSRADIDAIAARGEAAGCLAMPPTQMPDPIGYICCCATPTATWSSSPSTRACTPRPTRSGAATADDRRARRRRPLLPRRLRRPLIPTPSPPTSPTGFVNDHASALGSRSEGRDEYRSRLPGFLARFPGIRYDVQQLVVDGPASPPPT